MESREPIPHRGTEPVLLTTGPLVNSLNGVLALAKRVQGDGTQRSSSFGGGEVGVCGGTEWEGTGGKLFRAECLYLDLYDG